MANAAQSPSFLNKKARVRLFRHAEALTTEDPVNNDITCPLTPLGEAQAYTLGAILEGEEFCQVICSGAGRAQHTGRLASNHFTVRGDKWHNCRGRQLYSLASNTGNVALWALVAQVQQAAKAGENVSAESYAAYRRYDRAGLLDQLKSESLEVLGAVSEIETFIELAFFSHSITSQAIAEALFPQHTEAIAEIELGFCDCIELTTESCRLIRYLS